MFKKLTLAAFIVGLSISALNPVAEARSNTGTKPFIVETAADLVGKPSHSVYFWDQVRFNLVGETITNAVLDQTIFPLIRTHQTAFDGLTGKPLWVSETAVTHNNTAVAHHCSAALKGLGKDASGCGFQN